MYADGRLQAYRWLPRPVTHAGVEFTIDAGGVQWQTPSIASDDKAVRGQSSRFDLEALDRAVDVTNCAAGSRLLPQHVPGFERGAQLDVNIPLTEVAEPRKPKFKMRGEPFGFEREAGGLQIAKHLAEVGFTEVRQHPTIVQVTAPAHQRVGVGFSPEPGHQAAQKQLLGETHPRVRWHFEGAHFQQAQPAAGGLW